jgi:putative hydrolase of the HAD superfamily
MQQIKNIIFDLGGIFLEIDYQKTKDAFTNLGIQDFDALFTQHHANRLFEELETGKISELEFYKRFRHDGKVNFTNTEIKDAWNAMLGNFPLDRLEWLKAIKDKYTIFLFSNTNQIHYDAFMAIYESNTGKADFNSHFIKAYYSQYLGLRKPNAASFLAILEEQNLRAEETLFIDDTIKNIEAADALGIKTIHLVAPKTVLDLEL